MGRKTWRQGDPHAQNYAVCGDDLARINVIYHFYAPEYSSIDKMAKYDWNTFRNYVAFLADRMAPGTRRPHHDSGLTSCYHGVFLTWGHYHNNIVLFYQDSPITRSHFMDPTDRAIKGFYCSSVLVNCTKLSLLALSDVCPLCVVICVFAGVSGSCYAGGEVPQLSRHQLLCHSSSHKQTHHPAVYSAYYYHYYSQLARHNQWLGCDHVAVTINLKENTLKV